nr:hypothetical protein [Tanacetum cinerariifolium]
RRERVVGFEETQNRGESSVERNNECGRPLKEAPRGNESQNVNLPLLLAAHIGRSENGQPLQSSLTSVYEGQALSNKVDPNIDGEHGFDYLTSALVSSKVHREGCRASHAPVMRTPSTAAKPCQEDSLEFYLITGTIYTDQWGTAVIATVFDEVTKTLSSISVDYL